ncbi:MAG: hypothetical protein Fur0044_14670 [Anaerolineae bacterium]|nr:hypothetical protein [Anaerolineales bacterium]MCQ3979374.1 hypothetical protein [Anaerolineae bacterium]
MVTILLELPDDLAQRLTPLRDRLPEIIELGLRQWSDAEPALTSRQRVEQIWAATGLIVPLDPAIARRYAKSRQRRTPIQAGGKPASEIIIEQRGKL